MAHNACLYGHEGGTHVLRFIGDIRYPMAPSLEDFLDRLFTRTRPDGFVIDLRQASSIDSTNLGLLARLAKRMRKAKQARVTLLSDQSDINELLLSMGFDSVFDLVERCDPAPLATQPIKPNAVDAEELGRTVLNAHRDLMGINQQNNDEFRKLVDMLEQERADTVSHH